MPGETYAWTTLEKRWSYSALIVHMSPLCFLMTRYKIPNGDIRSWYNWLQMKLPIFNIAIGSLMRNYRFGAGKTMPPSGNIYEL